MRKKEYQLIVKTNSYAGNFEREMCAFMTGQIGECGVGDNLVEEDVEELFNEKISGKNDHNGVFRPVSLDDDDSNNFIIHLEEKLNEEDMKFLTERAHLFEKKRPYEYLDKNFKFLGLEQIEVETLTKRTRI